MSGGFLSPFQLIESRVDAVTFESLAPKPQAGSDAALSLGHFIDEDDMFDSGDVLALKCSLSVTCEWLDEDGAPFCQGKCDIRGAVAVSRSAFGESFPDGEIDLLLRANAISLLYGEARALIKIVSANTSSGKQTLPAIDPFSYLHAEEDAPAGDEGE